MEDLQQQMGQADELEDLQQQPDQTDVLRGLREQIIQAEEEFELEERAGPAQFLRNLEPWQRFVLATLLFLNVALCGCMGLVMAGRVVSPF